MELLGSFFSPDCGTLVSGHVKKGKDKYMVCPSPNCEYKRKLEERPPKNDQRALFFFNNLC